MKRMKPQCVVVVAYGDHEFEETVKNALSEYKKINLKFYDICSPVYFQTSHTNLLLINADQFHLKPNQAKELIAVIGGAGKSEPPIVLMLTKNLSASDFLRNQIYRVTDTIDIGAGMDLLKTALDLFLIRKAGPSHMDSDKARSGGV